MREVEVEVSARHVHLSEDDYNFFFGQDAPFERIKELSQTGEFASNKVLKVAGPKGELPARFLGPFRQKTQVELSMSDCMTIGIKAPVEVDDSENASLVKLIGQVGEAERKAAIVAKRHLHCNSREAAENDVSGGQLIAVEIKTDRGTVIFKDIIVRVADNYNLRLHIDTDEGNAAGISGECFGEIIQ